MENTTAPVLILEYPRTPVSTWPGDDARTPRGWARGLPQVPLPDLPGKVGSPLVDPRGEKQGPDPRTKSRTMVSAPG